MPCSTLLLGAALSVVALWLAVEMLLVMEIQNFFGAAMTAGRGISASGPNVPGAGNSSVSPNGVVFFGTEFKVIKSLIINR